MDNPGLPQGVTDQSISLFFGHPDPTTLNTPPFQEAVQRVMTSPHGFHALEYGNEQGNVGLIEYLARRISREQGLNLTSANVMICGGSTSAVDMITRLYAKPDGVVIVEAPSYVDSLHVFRDHGVTLRSVPMDEEGVLPDAFEAVVQQVMAGAQKSCVFYTIPNCHNPTGITTSEARRRAIIKLAQQYGVMIVEDDVYRDLAFEAEVPPSYLTLADGVRVIQVGSFSKTIAPGLRLGWLASDAETVERCVNCGTTQMGGGANPLAAQIVAEFCRQGAWDAHLEHIRGLYQTRRDTMLDALARTMPKEVRWTHPLGGFFVWLTLPETVLGAEVKAQALKRGVIAAAGEGYFINRSDGAHNMRLAFSFASLVDIDRAVRILAEVISGIA